MRESPDPRRHVAEQLANTIGFELLSEELGADVESSLVGALASGVVFEQEVEQPVALFRKALADAVVAIQKPPRDQLFRDFLIKGPYEGAGTIPLELRDQRLSDDQTNAAITLVFSYMVNCFKGAVAELLAVAPCMEVLRQMRDRGALPQEARLYVGDAVRARGLGGKSFAKAGDMHILVLEQMQDRPRRATVAGVAEVKSYYMSDVKLQAQLDKHMQRACRGLEIGRLGLTVERPVLGVGAPPRVARITVVPAQWTLPRTIRFESSNGGRRLVVDPPTSPEPADQIEQIRDDCWLITLRWSQEALEAIAHEMTFWYMERMGELIYADGVPKDWSEMSAAEAGRNAAKEKLYYAILRCRSGSPQEQRAIALYNSYGFGYALGTSFRDANGRRQMLWSRDLDEVAATGRTASGCRIVP